MRSLAAALLALAAMLLLHTGIALANEDGEPTRVVPFQLKALDGTSFDSDRQLSGRVSVVSFWRLEQKRSIKNLKELIALRAAFPRDELNIITILSGETDATQARAIVEDLGLSFPVLLDPERNAYADFEVIVSPTSWFIDTDENKRFVYPGHRRDFATTANAHVDFLLGRISEEEHASRIEKKAAPRSTETMGAPVRYRFAQRLLRDGDRQGAKDQLRQAWEADPSMPEAGVELGILLMEDGELKEALAVLDKAATSLPDNQRAQGVRGIALIRSGQAESGEPLLREALEHERKEPLFFYEMGRLNERRGDKDEALLFYRAALELLIRPAAQPAGER